jgi:hypothetical protein
MAVSMRLVMVTSMILRVVAVALRTLHSQRYTTGCAMMRGVVLATGFYSITSIGIDTDGDGRIDYRDSVVATVKAPPCGAI